MRDDAICLRIYPTSSYRLVLSYPPAHVQNRYVPHCIVQVQGYPRKVFLLQSARGPCPKIVIFQGVFR